MLRTIIAAGLLGAVACGGEVHLAQEVLDVQVHASGECPPSVTVYVSLGIGACDRVLSPSVEHRRGEITVRPWVATRDETCISILLSHDLEVPLGRLEGGTYRLLVEGDLRSLERTFTVPDACR